MSEEKASKRSLQLLTTPEDSRRSKSRDGLKHLVGGFAAGAARRVTNWPEKGVPGTPVEMRRVREEMIGIGSEVPTDEDICLSLFDPDEYPGSLAQEEHEDMSRADLVAVVGTGDSYFGVVHIYRADAPKRVYDQFEPDIDPELLHHEIHIVQLPCGYARKGLANIDAQEPEALVASYNLGELSVSEEGFGMVTIDRSLVPGDTTVSPSKHASIIVYPDGRVFVGASKTATGTVLLDGAAYDKAQNTINNGRLTSAFRCATELFVDDLRLSTSKWDPDLAVKPVGTEQ